MIKFTVTRNGQEADIRFPCTEKDIRRVQTELDIPYERDTCVKILAVDSDIEEFFVLKGKSADLDFLNLLGRLMYGMDEHEYRQFRMGLYHEKASDLKDIINITQSVNRYSIITDDLYESGLDHEMDLRGGIPTSEVNVTDYSKVAKELIDSGKCEETPYGKLYVNEEIPIDKFFDGRHMPPYFDRDFQIACFLESGSDRDFLMLPCTDAELQRSAMRLGAGSPHDPGVKVVDFNDHNSDLVARLIKHADIWSLNGYAALVDGFDADEKDKFMAVLSYADRSYKEVGGLGTLSAAVKIGGVLDVFTWYPNVMGDRELGATILEEREIPEDLWDYFDVERCGGDFRADENGDYSSDGYVGIDDSRVLRNAMSQNQGMGGIQ